VKIGESVKFACVDGPDFDGHLVDFDDLMSRLARFKPDEKAALQRWEESCRLRGTEALEKAEAAIAAPSAEPELELEIDRPSTDG
jgi:hypothetical protein